MADGGIDPAHLQRERFLLTQLLVMALPGVPAFYLPALMATPNDLARFRRTGQRRDLNRPQFRTEALERRLQDPDSDLTAVLAKLRQALAVRASLSPLHPDADLTVLSQGRLDRVILRRAREGQTLLAVHNMTSSRLTLRLSRYGEAEDAVWTDCLSGEVLHTNRLHSLEPYAVHWLIQR